MPRLALGRDSERRGLLSVEWAQALEDRPRAFELNGLADDVDDR